MSDVAAVLRKARDLYAANPSHVAAEIPVAHGEHCPYTAIMESGVVDRDTRLSALDVLQAAVEIPPNRRSGLWGPTAKWNAENSTETVLAAFDKAITEADNA
jgi:hypothetical protein